MLNRNSSIATFSYKVTLGHPSKIDPVGKAMPKMSVTRIQETLGWVQPCKINIWISVPQVNGVYIKS